MDIHAVFVGAAIGSALVSAYCVVTTHTHNGQWRSNAAPLKTTGILMMLTLVSFIVIR